ncbi:MAG: sialidase family protein [Chloroflexi bacterium]|nr:sialidase family protein [Chloroflexota bacterium]
MVKQFVRSVTLLMALLGLATAVYFSAPATTTAETPFPPIPLRERVPVPSQISAVGKNVDSPTLAQAPNGQLMVSFNQWVAGNAENSDPYYSISANNGQTWTTPAPIATLANTKSITAITYDSNNVAHAVWSETQLGTTKVFYANRQTGSWSAPLELASAPFASQGVDIVASRPGVVDVIWDIDYGPPTDGLIQHKRFTLSGGTWTGGTTLTVNDTFTTFGLVPAIAADSNGNLHAVWQGQFDAQIYYSRLNVGAGAWTQPSFLVSTDILSGKSYEPDVAVYNNTVYVGISYRQDGTIGTTFQAVFERHCGNATGATSCLAPTGWSPIRNISGSFLKVTANDPFYIAPQFALMQAGQYRQANLFVHYHGFIPGGEGNEMVWRTDACSEWAGSLPAQLTASNERSINPSGQVRVSGSIVTAHTAYEGVSLASRAIYYVQSSSNCGQIFLPLIQK